MTVAFRVVKWVLGLILLFALTLILIGSFRLSRPVEVAAHEAPPPATDPVRIAEGRRLAEAFACTECHGPGLEGMDFLEGGPFMMLPAPDLTGARFTAEQLERSIRHGIGADGRVLVIMPSEAFVGMSDADLGALVGYIESLPARNTPLIERSIGPIGRAVSAFQAPVLQPARRIEQATTHPATHDGAVARFGSLCSTCHGADYGGQVFAAEEALWAPNLTGDATGAASWSLEQFSTAVRQGRTPDGRTLDSANMPWKGFSHLTDGEVREIWEFLRALPPVERPRPTDM